MKILITGGSGYIASHVCLELLWNNHKVLGAIKPKSRVLRVINQVKALTARNAMFYYKADVCDEVEMDRVIGAFRPQLIINLAGMKLISPTQASRLLCWNVNSGQLRTLVKTMERYGVDRLIHASTGNLSSPYETMSFIDQTKYSAENYLQDMVRLGSTVKVVCLRLFHPSANVPCGYLAEDDYSASTTLLHQISKAATKETPCVRIYPRINDYIHVSDVARAFRKTVERFDSLKSRFSVYDIGSGVGVKDIDILQKFEEINHVKVPYRIRDVLNQEPAFAVADINAATLDLDWHPIKNLNEICNDTWFSHTLGTNSLIPAPFSRISSWYLT